MILRVGWMILGWWRDIGVHNTLENGMASRDIDEQADRYTRDLALTDARWRSLLVLALSGCDSVRAFKSVQVAFCRRTPESCADLLDIFFSSLLSFRRVGLCMRTAVEMAVCGRGARAGHGHGAWMTPSSSYHDHDHPDDERVVVAAAAFRRHSQSIRCTVSAQIVDPHRPDRGR